TVLHEYFRPVVEGKAWMNDLGQHWKITMNTTEFLWQYGGQSSFSDSNRTQSISPNAMSASTTYYLRLRAKNVGGKTWTRSLTKLGTTNPIDRASVFSNDSWPNSNRAARLKESSVAPGETGTFE